MKAFAMLCKVETRLFIRDFFSCFFTLVFPLLMLVLFGGIFGNMPIYEGAAMNMMDVSVPAYTVMVIGVTGLMSLPLTLSGYQEKKIYKRFDASPAGKRSVMLAQVVINLIMTLIGIAILLIAGRLLYDIQIKGDFIAICMCLFISITALFSMGFLFSAIGQDSKTTTLLCYLCYFIMLFLSGATMPDLMFPDAIKRISDLLPMSYAVDLMQGVFAGDTLVMHQRELIILGIVAFVCITIGAAFYKRKDWT